MCLCVNRSIQVSVVCDLELDFVYMYCLNYIYSKRKKVSSLVIDFSYTY